MVLPETKDGDAVGVHPRLRSTVAAFGRPGGGPEIWEFEMAETTRTRQGGSWIRRNLLAPLGAVAVVASLLGAAAPVAAQEAPVLCDSSGVEQFSDVAAGDYGAAYILCARVLGLTAGRASGDFDADGDLSRAQMAVFLVRLWRDTLGRACPGEPAHGFADVSGSWAAAEIGCLYALGITKGTSASTYSPSAKLNTSQVTRFAARLLNKVEPATCDLTGDVLASAAECLVGLNIAPSIAEATAAAVTTRAQMAVYLVGAWHYAAGNGQPPKPPTRDLELVYTVEDGWNDSLWTATPQGSRKNQLATLHSSYSFALSHDGSRVAYSGRNGGYVLDIDSGEIRTLREPAPYQRVRVSLSPDGRFVNYYVYVMTGPRDESLLGTWIEEYNGQHRRKISIGSENVGVKYSPDSRYILYRLNDGIYSVENLYNDHGPVRIASEGDWTVDDAGFTPDGRVYYMRRNYVELNVFNEFLRPDELWVMNPDGTGRNKISDNVTSRVYWSHDGSKITYREGKERVLYAQLDGESWTEVPYLDSQDYIIADSAGEILGRVDRSGTCEVVWWLADNVHAVFDYGDREVTLNTTSLSLNTTRMIGQEFENGLLGRSQWIHGTISPDLHSLAYVIREEDRSLEIWTMNFDGSNRKKLVEVSDQLGIPQLAVDDARWSPDGRYLAYHAYYRETGTENSSFGHSLWIVDTHIGIQQKVHESDSNWIDIHEWVPKLDRSYTGY